MPPQEEECDGDFILYYPQAGPGGSEIFAHLRSPINDDDSDFALSTTVTHEEKQEIIVRYAQLYLDHINEKCPPSAAFRIELLGDIMLWSAQLGFFLSPATFMLCYDLNYERYLPAAEKEDHSLHREVHRFGCGHNWWTSRCISLSDQAKRLALVKGVVEVLKVDSNDPFIEIYRRVRDCCRTYRPDGVRSVSNDVEEQLMEEMAT